LKTLGHLIISANVTPQLFSLIFIICIYQLRLKLKKAKEINALLIKLNVAQNSETGYYQVDDSNQRVI